jgi:hypothetical protein
VRLPTRGSEPADHFVSISWWLRYLLVAVPGPLSSADIICDHGALKRQLAAETEGLAIALTATQYETLAAAYGAVGAPLRDLAPCRECLVEARLLQERRAREKARITELDTTWLPTASPVDAEAEEDRTLWYLISEWWLFRWRSFINNDGPSDGTGRGILPPGPIDNARLLDRSGEPLPNLRPIVHYRGVNVRVWRFLLAIYGGGPVLRRKEINVYLDVAPPASSPRRF